MTTRFTMMTLSLPLTFALAGCPITSRTPIGGTPGGDGPIAIDDLGAALVSAECALEVKCLLVSDQAFCTASLTPSLLNQGGFNSFGSIVAAVRAGKITYSASQARTCVDSIAMVTCQSTDVGGLSGSACASVFTGTVADGGACISDQECVGQSTCVQPAMSSSTSCIGTCTAAAAGQCRDDSGCATGMTCDNGSTCVTPVAAGAVSQPCGTEGTCQAGLFCAPNGGTSTCTALAQAGQTCSVGVASCVAGLACIPTDDGMSSLCAALKTTGDACTHLYECGGDYSSIACDPTTNKCIARPSSGPCVGGFLCDDLTSQCDTSQQPPTCLPYIADNAACDTTAVQQCQPTSNCRTSGTATTGTCVSALGPACTP